MYYTNIMSLIFFSVCQANNRSYVAEYVRRPICVQVQQRKYMYDSSEVSLAIM